MRSITAAIAAATATAIVVSSSFVIAAIPDSTTKVITVCYLKSSGAMRLIDKATKATCNVKTETELSWNQQGVKGDAGPQGLLGATGPAGANGQNGQNGLNGLNGADGAAGRDGIDGAQGAQGYAGIDGGTGPQGVQGEPGSQGPVGVDGAPGPQGAAGLSGPQGPTGPAGSLTCADELRILSVVPNFPIRDECKPIAPPEPDTTAPTIAAMIVTPSSARQGGQVTVEMTVTDPSGVQDVTYYFSNYSGWIESWCGQTLSPLDASQRNRFVASYTCDLPADLAVGTYFVGFRINDVLGNSFAQLAGSFDVIASA